MATREKVLGGSRPAAKATQTRTLTQARIVLQQFLADALEARESRVIKIAPAEPETAGWTAEAEVLVPNLEVRKLGLPLQQEVLTRERYAVELRPDLSVRSYVHLDEGEE